MRTSKFFVIRNNNAHDEFFCLSNRGYTQFYGTVNGYGPYIQRYATKRMAQNAIQNYALSNVTIVQEK